MKRLYSLSIAALGTCVALMGQSKFDSNAAKFIADVNANRQAKMIQSRFGANIRTVSPQTDTELPVMAYVCMHNESQLDVLDNLGLDIVTRLGRIAICNLTPAQMEQLATLDEVLQISVGEDLKPMLNFARIPTGVDEAHSGSAAIANHSFTGEGVICGMMDTGFDAGHLNFRTKEGATRLSRLWVIQGQTTDAMGNVKPGTPRAFTTPAEINNFISQTGTDTNDGTHATHVMGIMAGSYNETPGRTSGSKSVPLGEVAYIDPSTGSTTKLSTRPVPYYGVAKDADLAVCCGTLHNANITAAAGFIRDYSKESGMPAVMNLSLGNNIGPHDGTDDGSEALAAAGKDILICISAGNEGGTKLSVAKQFSGSDNTLKTFVSGSASVNGSVDIWGDNNQPLTVKVLAVEPATGKVTYSYTIPANQAYTYIGGTNLNYSNVAKDANFGNAFGQSAFIGYSANVNVKNNRHNVSISFNFPANSSIKTIPAIEITGGSNPGVNMFGRDITFSSRNLAGFTDGSVDNTINGMGCGDNVLVVGAYVNNNKFHTLGGTMSFNGANNGAIASFSSHGTTFAGKKLPDVVGPGMGMISSYSKHYVTKYKSASNEYMLDDNSGTIMSAWVYTDKTKRTTKDYWGEMSGTSMSSPFVAGVLALWSQAAASKGEPLSMDRVKEIIAKTAIKDSYTSSTPDKWGMGKINAIGGLKEILGTGALNSVGADDPAGSMIVENLGGKQMNVFVGGTDGFTARLYNLQGGLSLTCASEGNNAAIDASSLADGIYLLEVSGDNFHTSRKIVVK